MKRAWKAAAAAAVLACACGLGRAEPPAGTGELTAMTLYGSAETAGLARALEQGTASWNEVRDYEALFKKQEAQTEGLGPEEKIFLKFEKPFKIFLDWLNTQKKGLQVFYERGKHNGKLAIHKPGLLLGLAPVIFLDQTSPWVREGSASFDIEDAGIGTFLEDFTEAVLRAYREHKLVVREDSAEAGQAFDVTFEGTKEGEGYFAQRVLVTFDAATKLPTRMSLFDWNGRPIGIYVYEAVKLNVGRSGSEFQKLAHRALRRLYTGDRG